MQFNPLPIILTLVGGYFIIKLRGFFILHPLRTAKKAIRALKHKGTLSSLSLALAGTLGVGNVFGVAYGIILGGAGSVFWLFVSSVFASVIKYAEVVISQDNLFAKRNGHHGGMYYVIKASFAGAGKFMSGTYALACLLLSVVMGAALQSSTMVESLSFGLGIQPKLSAAAFAALVFVAIVGGSKIITRVTSFAIPMTTVIYIVLTSAIIIVNFSRLPAVLTEIMSSAFTVRSGGGGVLAFMLTGACKEGYSRGMLSNEAGAGTSSMAHARSGILNPASAGIMGIVEVFFDTALLCMLTAFAILVTVPDPSSFSGGMELVTAAVGGLGVFGEWVLLICVFFFAYSTAICWYYYGNECASFLSPNGVPFFAILYSLAVFLGGVVGGGVLVMFTDGLMIILTLLTLSALIKNSDRVIALSESGGVIPPKKNIKGILFSIMEKRR